jgi:hypothetical protein
MNHRSVEAASFDGEQWNVPFKNQFGWEACSPPTGRAPGHGARREPEARFKDDGGATVVFRPVGDPSVRPVEDALCD